MRLLNKFLLIVAVSISVTDGFSQTLGLFYSRNQEFIEFQNQQRFYSILEEGTKISDKKLVFRSGFYERNYDTLFLIPNNDSSFRIANVLTSEVNTKDSLCSIFFYNMSRYIEIDLVIELFNYENVKYKELYMKNRDSVNLSVDGLYKLNIFCMNDRDKFEYSLYNDDLLGKRILIQTFDQPPLKNNFYLIKCSSKSSFTLIGPVYIDYKQRNRRKWLNSFRNWPWEWSLKKEHWYDPIERNMNMQSSNKKYFLSK
ncbi:MAG TPA: hypothetical protein PKI35_07435 [Bacteroidales bacterium]|nr:hypothetical protein [Bacteroidales bacterium]